MEIQVYSDLHLEHFHNAPELAPPVDDIPVLCDNLALLGDIGDPAHPSFAEYVAKQADRFKRVFVVAGNHEYYHKSMGQTIAALESVCAQRDNIILLERSSVDIECGGEEGEAKMVRVVGATLWSHAPEDCAEKLQHSVNDYRRIFVNGADGRRTLTTDDTNAMHAADVAFIAAEIDRAAEDHIDCVVLTHHAPSLDNTYLPATDRSGLGEDLSFFTYLNGSDQTRLLEHPSLRLWAFGHTHYSCRHLIGGTRVVSNALGYTHPSLDHSDPNFDWNVVFCTEGEFELLKPTAPNLPRHMSAAEEACYTQESEQKPGWCSLS